MDGIHKNNDAGQNLCWTKLMMEITFAATVRTEDLLL